MKAPILAYSELTGTIYICYGKEKVDVTEQAIKMVKAVLMDNVRKSIISEKAGDKQ